ncbi:flavin reductase family protein [Amycolatopsis australiensis]|uniref:NADH-FMN oxidoreductase RutF, flavin reductase (DIM6/NTAB) family n=1 Tax=Amycolatopsis australiensis TaxID=546364 RepID=A0A1K1RZG4_9PSEU|nr:flavin reductase family protein [Amycolatopsis australiensis]SFW77191.1 NADH-FMN oxidoreductase RutF, flavin reductase (DIM6/NTAB) family [Amycolatopsis australiensis]
MPNGDDLAGRFDDLVGRLDYPMYVVTCADGDRWAGCLVGFAAQCSISPPRFMVWLSKANHTTEVAAAAPALGVHRLTRDHAGLARLFGSHSGSDVDKFARTPARPGPLGVPVIDACADWFVGEILSRHDTGDHIGFLLRPVAATAAGGPQLGFQDVRDLPPGNDP